MASQVIYYLSLLEDTPKRGYWDYGLLDDIFSNFKGLEVSELPVVDYGVVIIPARSHKDSIKQFNKELSKIKRVMLFLMGDEEADFPVEEIKHNDIEIWVQNPVMGRHDSYNKLGCGYPQNLTVYKCHEPKKRIYDFMFAGQVTHARRTEAVYQMENVPNGYLLPTEGFTQGLSPEDYYDTMQQSKVAVCPSGPITVDTFRIYEALELGCIPIADTQTPHKDMTGFWEWLFEQQVEFLQIKDMSNLPNYIQECLPKYPMLNNRIQANWIQYKHKIYSYIMSSMKRIGYSIEEADTTVLIPISPIQSHPETDILDETLKSIKAQLPNAKILLLFDGVREEQEHTRASYEEHIQRVLWNLDYKTTIPVVFDNHLHQIGTFKAVADAIDTDFIMYVEQDTPLVTDIKIDWTEIKNFIKDGHSNLVRLYHEGIIPKEHNHLMLEKTGSFQETIQWSQRPHIASTPFYKRIINQYFSENANCFIEDLLHGKAIETYEQAGRIGWNDWKLHIYTPKGQIKLSYTTDGRAGGQKFDDKQTW